MSSKVNHTIWIYITTILVIINNLVVPSICGTFYALDTQSKLWSIDASGNVLDTTDGVLSYAIAMEYDCINQVMYLSYGDESFRLCKLNTTTGATSCEGFASGTDDADMLALAYGGATLYGYKAAGDNDGGFRIINTATTPPDDTTVLSANIFNNNEYDDPYHVSGLAYDINTDTMYGIWYGAKSEDNVLFTLDLETGLPCFIGYTGEPISALTIDDNGVLYGTTGDLNALGTITPVPTTGMMYTIDMETGKATFFAQISNDFINALAFVTDSGTCITKSPTSYPTAAPSTKLPTKLPTLSPVKSSSDSDDH